MVSLRTLVSLKLEPFMAAAAESDDVTRVVEECSKWYMDNRLSKTGLPDERLRVFLEDFERLLERVLRDSHTKEWHLSNVCREVEKGMFREGHSMCWFDPKSTFNWSDRDPRLSGCFGPDGFFPYVYSELILKTIKGCFGNPSDGKEWVALVECNTELPDYGSDLTSTRLRIRVKIESPPKLDKTIQEIIRRCCDWYRKDRLPKLVESPKMFEPALETLKEALVKILRPNKWEPSFVCKDVEQKMIGSELSSPFVFNGAFSWTFKENKIVEHCMSHRGPFSQAMASVTKELLEKSLGDLRGRPWRVSVRMEPSLHAVHFAMNVFIR